MVVKQFSNENLRGLTDLMNQWSSEVQYKEAELADSIERMMQKSDSKVFIAQNDEGKVIGYAATGICYYLGLNPFVEVIQLLVDTNNRSQGIGKMLIEHVSEHYRKEGVKEIKLHSRIERERAHAFYRKHGFTEFKQSKFFEKQI